jgi:hypothetical protein
MDIIKQPSASEAKQLDSSQADAKPDVAENLSAELGLPPTVHERVADQPAIAQHLPHTRRVRASLVLQRKIGNQAVNRLLQRSLNKQSQVQLNAPTIQQTLPQQVHSATIQRRRIPDTTEITEILTDNTPAGPTDAANYDAHKAGLTRLLLRSWNELSLAEQGQVLIILFAPPASPGQFAALPERDRLVRISEAIGQVKPSLKLGDPRLIDIGPRAGTADAANLAKLVRNTNRLFNAIASGRNDRDIDQVFGRANRSTAKAKYANGRIWLNRLHQTHHTVTDRSGYNKEVGLGGLTGFRNQISVSPGTIDNPDDPESIITTLHESMHAGNSSVTDLGYINQPSFTKLAARDKLNNAAHYEVVPRRILRADPTFAGQTFIPAGSTGPGGSVAPPLTSRQQAIRDASETFREAWTLGLNLHMLFVRVYRSPNEWTTLDLSRTYGTNPGLHFADTLPFWSKVEKLTIHEKTVLNPTGHDASTNPVSLIDISLSEGLVRKLAKAMKSVPGDEATAAAFEQTHASAAERAAATSASAERDLLIMLVLRNVVGEITGKVERDIRMVDRLAHMGDSFAVILARRSPGDFPD